MRVNKQRMQTPACGQRITKADRDATAPHFLMAPAAARIKSSCGGLLGNSDGWYGARRIWSARCARRSGLALPPPTWPVQARCLGIIFVLR